MCVKLRTAKVKPGSIFGFKTSKGVSSGIWGLNKGNQYNARSERLDGIWKELKRAVIYVDSFWEGGVEFKKADGGDFAIGIIFNSSKEFAVLTCAANDVVKLYHERMPFVIDDSKISDWLENGNVLQLHQDQILLAAA